MQVTSLLKTAGVILAGAFVLESVAMELIVHDPSNNKLSGAIMVMMTFPLFLLAVATGAGFLLAGLFVAIWRAFNDDEDSN